MDFFFANCSVAATEFALVEKVLVVVVFEHKEVKGIEVDSKVVIAVTIIGKSLLEEVDAVVGEADTKEDEECVACRVAGEVTAAESIVEADKVGGVDGKLMVGGVMDAIAAAGSSDTDVSNGRTIGKVSTGSLINIDARIGEVEELRSGGDDKV